MNLKSSWKNFLGKKKGQKVFMLKKDWIFLKSRKEGLEDYEEAREAHLEFIASGEKAASLDSVFKDVK